MNIRLATLLGGTFVECKRHNFSEGVKHYSQPSPLQIKLAGLLLGKNAALAANFPVISDDQWFTSSGIPYAGQAILDYDRIGFTINAACGAGAIDEIPPQGAGFLARQLYAMKYRFGVKRAGLTKAVLGLN